jgi:predicted phosphodiesterase
MSKTVVIGDIHGRDSWKQIIKDQNPDRVVFMGDYFDSYDNNEQNKYTTGNIPDFVNDLWTYKPGVFRFTGLDQSGNSKTQTPIFITSR